MTDRATAVDSPYGVAFDGTFQLSGCLTEPEKDPGKKTCKQRLETATEQLAELQRRLYAQDRYAVLLVFQAMDAAGKDSTIRAVMSGVNPAGCQVFAFKAPSDEELDHDFLWRTARRLPERGRIGIFNRSYYEEVLVVRVHPELLERQRLPASLVDPAKPDRVWAERLESIRDHERHLARNGTVVIKFFLNVSREEQKARFIDRIDKERKNWKFSARDVDERAHWDDYMHAYEQALRATSTPWAPWYAIPADDKPYMRMVVAELVVETLSRLDIDYPPPDPDVEAALERYREQLKAEKD